MSRFASALGRQLSHPEGVGGWLTAQAMRVANRRVVAASIDALDVQPGDDVLDLGCGAGDALPRLAQASRGGRICGVDHSSAMLASAALRCPSAILSKADFCSLPFADESIDRILAVNVAYFWPDDRSVLAEITRVMRPGGRLVVYVTDGGALARMGLDRTGTHRLFDAAGLQAMLGPTALVRHLWASRGIGGWLAVVPGTASSREDASPTQNDRSSQNLGS